MQNIRSVVVLTGAGISQESGIQTFRGADGLWEGHRPEEVATPQAYQRNPKLVQEFYNQRRRQLLTQAVKPNAAHLALAQFEQQFDGEFHLVTQNVDNLHERAGSSKVLHMHGELLKARCDYCGNNLAWEADLSVDMPNPCCSSKSGGMRPHIVWFGEFPFYMDAIEQALEQCDLFISIGTSGLVYPAANFVRWTKTLCQKVELNLEGTPLSSYFDQHLQGKASVVVPQYFNQLSSGR